MFKAVTLVVVLALASTAFAAVAPLTQEQHESLFHNWMAEHRRNYKDMSEYYHRFEVFQKNVEFIRNHNAAKKGFTLAANHFADMTMEEFKSIYLGFQHQPLAAPRLHMTSNLTLPTSVDWRTKGVVTPVKDQGQCGSCYTFSSTGSMEGAWAIAGNPLTSLSEQNLIDCSTSYGNQGCNGGLMNNCFQYVIDNAGDDTEASYPYTGQDGTCNFNSANVGVTLSSFANITEGDEKSLQDAIANNGPVSVAIDANHSEFMYYSSGVLNIPDCSTTQLDHGVLAVGYGATSDGTQYYIVKNSWSASWGLSGYVWMSRNKNNQCGIATAASYPIV